jgi:hypothetical protein
MKTKIGTSFGLALLLALGVLATMLALGTFSAPKAEADVDIQLVSISPTTPGDNSSVTIDFLLTGTAGDPGQPLIAGADQIWVEFDKNWTVPSTIAKERITITSSQTTGGTSNPAVDPSIEVDGTTSNITVKLTIGDTDPATAGVQNLHPQATGVTTVHKIVFSPLAGIKNPVVSATAASATNWIRASTTKGGGTASFTDLIDDNLGADNAVTIARTVTLNSTSGANGATITVTGKGFTSGGTATVFRDVDASGTFTPGDLILTTGSAAVASGAFTATITVNTTQFGVLANQINAFDGTGTVATNVAWTLIGSVTTDKTSVKRGETVTVKLRQFANGAPLTLSIGGAGINVTTGGPSGAALGTPVANSADWVVTVPTTTPLGIQTVSASVVGEAARTTTIEVIGAPLTLSPSTAVPEQEINISGSGFTVSSTVPPATGVTVQGTVIVAANIAGGTTPSTDSSGNVNFQVKIESTATTRTAGTYDLQVIDASGRTGSAKLTIPSRVVTLEPASSRRGTTVTVTGTGFPAKQSVTLTYGATTVASVTPDGVGAFTTTFVVPNTAGIPSSNTVTATSSGTLAPTGTATHAVPAATIAVSPSSVSPGGNVTVTATGFPGFASMTALTIGGVSAIPTPAPATGEDGAKTAEALVPALSLGPQTVSVTIGGITGTSSVTIVAAPVAPVVPVVAAPVATATTFAAVIAQADNLVRVWRYSNADQSWVFYDPRPAFAAANTLATTAIGNIVWVNVKVQQTFQGQTLYAGWNQIALTQ